jgi:RHS repeat-associated protein
MNYDAEGRMNPVSGLSYTYDGDGRRVEKSDGTVYWLDDASQPFSVGTTSGSITRDYLYFGGQRIAFVAIASGNPYYFLSDNLNSTAVIASGDGKTIQWEADYFPFGSVRQVFTNLLTNNYQFTGDEFDFETGYNYSEARYQAGTWGRFLSPDPYAGSMDLSNPQSLNRYAYVMNNPANATDPSGLIGDSGFGPDPGPPGSDYLLSCELGINCNSTGLSGFFGGLPPVKDGIDVYCWDCWTYIVNPDLLKPGEILGASNFDISRILSGLAGAIANIGSATGLASQTARKAVNPCAGVDPKTFDYSTPRYYWSEGGMQSPYQHIMEGHVFPAPLPNTKYVSGIGPATNTNAPAVMAQVININAFTFTWGVPFVQWNGNISYTAFFPEIKVQTPIGTFTRKGIGQDQKTGAYLKTNVLVIENDCHTPVTSYPTAP